MERKNGIDGYPDLNVTLHLLLGLKKRLPPCLSPSHSRAELPCPPSMIEVPSLTLKCVNQAHIPTLDGRSMIDLSLMLSYTTHIATLDDGGLGRSLVLFGLTRVWGWMYGYKRYHDSRCSDKCFPFLSSA